jgi:hypothetical protein
LAKQYRETYEMLAAYRPALNGPHKGAVGELSATATDVSGRGGGQKVTDSFPHFLSQMDRKPTISVRLVFWGFVEQRKLQTKRNIFIPSIDRGGL